MAYIEIRNLSIRFSEKIIVSDFNLIVERGDKIVIKGPSGKGKTTILNALLGFERSWLGGALYFEGNLVDKTNMSWWRSHISWVPQDVSFYKGNVKDFIYLPFTYKLNKNKWPSEEKVMHFFEMFSLDAKLINSKIDSLSGGEKQRAVLISAFLLEKDIIILDEPTSALDDVTKAKIINYIMNKKEITLISASHDADWVNACQKTIEI